MVPKAEKRFYQSPELKVHGSVEKMTKNSKKVPGTADGQGSRMFE